MKITLIYLHVAKEGYEGAAPPEYYWPYSERWVKTYWEHHPGITHDLVIVSCGSAPNDKMDELYHGLGFTWECYTGGGSDIGACQYAMQHIDSDFVVCMSTPVYFWKAGWLKRLVEAREFFGDGLYGPMASNQNTPHIRTSCWCVSPKTFSEYSHIIDSRHKACWAESVERDGNWQISRWFESIGKPVLMVTWDRVCSRQDWRKPDNIFRRGNQSNCLVWDQYVDKYFAAHYQERLELERLANEDRSLISESAEKV